MRTIIDLKQNTLKMNKIEVKIDYKSHTETILKNGKGDTFTFNPQKYEELQDFLSGCNKSLIEEKEEVIKEAYELLYNSDGSKFRDIEQKINKWLLKVHKDHLKQKV